MRGSRPLFGAALCAALAGAVPAAVGRGAHEPYRGGTAPVPHTTRAALFPSVSDRERYIELLERKRRAEKQAALMRIEADLSAKKKAYVLLDLSERRIYFKVRGRTFKALSLNGVEMADGSGAAAPLELAGRAYTLELKEGKGVETESLDLKTLTPEEAARAGGKDVEEAPSEVEQGEVAEGAAPAKTAGTGAPPATQKMAGVAGGAIPPDPPPRYHLGFDGNLSIWVISEQEPDPRAARFERLLGIARSIGRYFVHGEGRGGTRLTIHLTYDRARQLFRQLICGQQLLIAP